MKKRNLIKRLTSSIILSTLLLPNIVLASTYSEINYGQEILNKSSIPVIEEKILNAKGFKVSDSDGTIVNYFYKRNRDVSKEDIQKIDAWGRDVIEKSGANKKKTQKEKAKFITAYLKTRYLYDVDAVLNSDLWESAQTGTLASKGTAICTGSALGLVRVLDLMEIESYMAYSYKGGSHAVVRAYLDGTWTTIEPTSYEKKFNLLDYIKKDSRYDINVFPEDITYVVSREELRPGYQTKYVVCIEKDIEDFLSENNFKFYGY